MLGQTLRVVVAAVLTVVAEAVLAAVAELAAGGVAGKVSRASNKDERAAVEAALRQAFGQVERHHAALVQGGSFDWSFVQHEAARELAKALVPGAADPDDLAIADAWASSMTTDPRTLVRLRAAALDASEELVAEFRRALDAQRVLFGLMGRRDEISRTESLEELVAAEGRSPADASARRDYLLEVCQEHRYLNTAGTGRAHHAQLPLERVFVTLSASIQTDPTDFGGRFVSDEVAELEALRRGGRIERGPVRGPS